MASSPAVLGDPLLMTQHFVGATRFEKHADDLIIGYHQLRVPHQKWVDETRKEVKVKGHAHSANKHWYRKIEGVWKFAGLCPDIRWGEYDFEAVFEEGRQEHGEDGKGADAGKNGEVNGHAANGEVNGHTMNGEGNGMKKELVV